MTKTGLPAALLALTLLAACGRTEQAADPGAAASPQRPQDLANTLPRGGGSLSRTLGGRGLPPSCPRVAMLGDAVDLTRFRAGSFADLSTMEVDARIVGVQARCEFASRNAGVQVTLFLQFAAERGPAATGRAVQIPYFVAVTDQAETQIFDRVVSAVTVTFPANDNRNAVAGPATTVVIPGDPNLAGERNIIVGFVLSPDEVALNRRRGPRT